MSDLYPTKTRLALLREVSEGTVVPYEDLSKLSYSLKDGRNLTARVNEARSAGWVDRCDLGCCWALTDAGRAVLDKAGQP